MNDSIEELIEYLDEANGVDQCERLPGHVLLNTDEIEDDRAAFRMAVEELTKVG